VALVVDTGVLLGALDAGDPAHAPCSELLSTVREELVVPAPVLVELDQLLGRRTTHDVWVAFSERVAEGGYRVASTDADSLLECARLQAKYADLRLGFVDAAVFVLCVELGETKVATLDRRHFTVLRTDDGRALQIVPELG
jgi:predicted nucleic acid-binding protein